VYCLPTFDSHFTSYIASPQNASGMALRALLQDIYLFFRPPLTPFSDIRHVGILFSFFVYGPGAANSREALSLNVFFPPFEKTLGPFSSFGPPIPHKQLHFDSHALDLHPGEHFVLNPPTKLHSEDIPLHVFNVPPLYRSRCR